MLNSPLTASEVAAHQGPAPLTAEQGQASSVFARHQLAPVIAESGVAIGTALGVKAIPEAQPTGILSGAKAGYPEGREVHNGPCFGLPVSKHIQSDHQPSPPFNPQRRAGAELDPSFGPPRLKGHIHFGY